jgi:hypothetical protein
MGAIGDSTWIVPLVSATQLYAATAIMTAGLAISLIVYQMWHQWHEARQKVRSQPTTELRRRA